MTQQSTNSTFHRQTNQTELGRPVDANSVEFIPTTLPPDLTTNAKRIWIDNVNETLSYTVDGSNIHQVTPNGDLGLVNVMSPPFSAVGNGIADDTVKIQNAATFAKNNNLTLYAPANKTFKVTSTVNFRQVRVIFEGTIIGFTTSIVALLGGTSASTINKEQSFYRINRDSGFVTANAVARVIGAKGQNISVHNSEFVELYADTNTDPTNDSSIAYSNFYFDKVDKVQLMSNLTTSGSLVQWINENSFWLKRTQDFIIDGTYSHNNNRVYTGSFESNGTITINKGNSNSFLGVRFETSGSSEGTATFGPETWDNRILISWQSSSSVDYNTKSVVVNDTGINNLVVFDSDSMKRKFSLTSTSSEEPQFNNSLNFGRVPALDKIYWASSATPIVTTSFFAVQQGDVIGVLTDDPNGRYRMRITFYDSAMRVIVDPNSTTEYNSSTSFTNTGGQLSSGVGNFKFSMIIVSDTRIKYAKSYIAGSSGQMAQATAKYAEIFLKRAIKTNKEWSGGNSPVSNYNVVTAIPTQSFCPVGYTLVKSDGTAFYNCSFLLDTTLSAPGAPAATTVTLTTATGAAVNDIIGIKLDTGDTHWTTVNNIAGTPTLGLTVALPSAAATGNRVILNRWATK